MFTRAEKEITTFVSILQADSYEWTNFKKVLYQHYTE